MLRRRRTILLGLTLLLALCSLAPAGVHAFLFKAPRYSALEGKPSGQDHFVLGGIEEECKEAYFEGAFRPRTLEVVPIYGDCVAKAMGGLPSKFILYGCAYLVRAGKDTRRKNSWTAPVDLTCRPTYSLRWQIYESEEKEEEATPVCTTVMHPQAHVGTAELSNMAGHPRDVTIHWHLDELEYEAYGSALYCGSPEAVVERGGTSYTGYSAIRATDIDELPKALSVGR